MSEEFFAHSANKNGDWHPLADHLSQVSKLAKDFSANASWQYESELAGLLHDLGKYGDRFQARLRGQDSGLDHWSQGAWLAISECRAIAAAIAIQGHHIGLQQANSDAFRRMEISSLVQNHPLRLDLSDDNVERLKQRLNTDGLNVKMPEKNTLISRKGIPQVVSSMLDIRLLFSCLVDADFLDTEAHFEGDASGKIPRLKGPKLNPIAALTALETFMTEKVKPMSHAGKSVLSVRETLWQEVTLAAKKIPGTFTLTAPTGSGKTLAMLKFALEHAVIHQLKRIVLVVPFLTIIEQTARIYKKVFQDFPAHYVLEHHSLAGLGSEKAETDAEENQHAASERQRRLLSENWDAPIILTTNVQLLESLFSNRPSSCRKLHNLMESVIMFDEAQGLPQHLVVPTLAALSHLSSAYRSTVLFATATQPAFDTLNRDVERLATSGWKPVEAAPSHADMFNTLKRVDVIWPKPGEKKDWEAIAEQLRDTEQVLCVVNLKRHATELLELLKGVNGVFHLSTNQCAEHRRFVLDSVRVEIREGRACRLISTQCVEAGADLDFPWVYRALAPFESIAQAAGRCNREGRMNVAGRLGRVVVFEPAEQGNWRRRYPTHAYFQAAEVTRTMLAKYNGKLDINGPDMFREYYRTLYDLRDPASQNTALNEALQARDFVEVARLYRLIEMDAIQVLVPWSSRRKKFTELKDGAEKYGVSAKWMRQAQGLAVSIYRPQAGHPAWSAIIPAKLRWGGGVSDEWFILEDPNNDFYDDICGLQLPQSNQVFIA